MIVGDNTMLKMCVAVLPLQRQHPRILTRNIALPPETHGAATQAGHGHGHGHGVHDETDSNGTIGAADVGGAANVEGDGGGGKKRHVVGAPSEDWTRLMTQPHTSTGAPWPCCFLSSMGAF